MTGSTTAPAVPPAGPRSRGAWLDERAGRANHQHSATRIADRAQRGRAMSGGESVLFWILGPLMVIAALGLIFAKKAVHAALGMALVMIGLGIIYFAQQAPFLGAVQIFVYTGAVMMLFLFVLMLVGVDSSDSLIETIKGQRGAAILLGIGSAVLLITVLGHVTFPSV